MLKVPSKNVLHGPKKWAKVFIGTFMKSWPFELFLIVLLKRMSLIWIEGTYDLN
jgi:hypothetical protein